MLNYTDFSTTNGEVTFSVSGFSSFLVKGSGIKYDLNKLDIDSCENGVQGNLIVDIKSPDEDESFGPGKEIEVKVKVENNNDEDEKFLVRGILFNVDEDDEEEKEESDYIKIDAGDTETFEFSITVPEDFDEEDNYFLFVKAYQKGEEETQCNYNIIDLSLEREEHSLIIDDVTIDPQIISANEKANIKVKVKNIGSSEEEEAYIKITNSQLGILGKSEYFDIEEHGEDDEVTISSDFLIPNEAKEGEYTFKVEVFFEDGSSSTTETINVLNSSYVQQEANAIHLSSSSSENTKATTSAKPVIASTGKVVYAIDSDSKDKVSEGILKVNLNSEGEQTPIVSKTVVKTKPNFSRIIIELIVGIVILLFLITLFAKKK
jgi:hypothetical protein